MALNIDAAFSDGMVLQQAPSRAAIYGTARLVAPMIVSATSMPSVLLSLIQDSNGIVRDTKEFIASVKSVAQQQTWAWKILLDPVQGISGVEYSVVAALVQQKKVLANVTLHRVVYGDVWVCAGQSNMHLPLYNTFSGRDALHDVLQGSYDNIRLTCGDSNPINLMTQVIPKWTSAKECATQNSSAYTGSPEPLLLTFCSVCWYFGESLTHRFKKEKKSPPTLGLVCIASGATSIEQWAPATALSDCANTLPPKTVGNPIGSRFFERIQPLSHMTIKGWLWYQGEHNLRGNAISGSFAGKYGYACALPAMLASWRRVWSIDPNTTSPVAPFGVVTLQPRASQYSGRDFGGLRHAQTAGFGVLPNAAMPNTFLAQGYDLPDPWNIDAQCYWWGCCSLKPNRQTCASSTASIGGPNVCDEYCRSVIETEAITLGFANLHSRLKRPIGLRLAEAAYRSVYGGEPDAALTGPTLAGCAIRGGQLVIAFNRSLLRREKLHLHKGPAHPHSRLEVLPKGSPFCLQPMPRCKGFSGAHERVNTRSTDCAIDDRELFCPQALDGEHEELRLSGKGVTDFSPIYFRESWIPPTTFWGDEWERHWVELNLTRISDYALSADLTPLNGTSVSYVRYAWGVHLPLSPERLCCNEENPLIGRSLPCHQPCPIVSSGGLPANPFLARIVNGKCECFPPQTCNEPIP